MAIERHKYLHRYPTGNMVLEADDRLLVVGNAEEHTAFEKLLKSQFT